MVPMTCRYAIPAIMRLFRGRWQDPLTLSDPAAATRRTEARSHTDSLRTVQLSFSSTHAPPPAYRARPIRRPAFRHDVLPGTVPRGARSVPSVVPPPRFGERLFAGPPRMLLFAGDGPRGAVGSPPRPHPIAERQPLESFCSRRRHDPRHSSRLTRRRLAFVPTVISPPLGTSALNRTRHHS